MNLRCFICEIIFIFFFGGGVILVGPLDLNEVKKYGLVHRLEEIRARSNKTFFFFSITVLYHQIRP